LAAVLALAATARDTAAEEWSLRLEAGSEYDTNIHRLEVVEGNRDPDSGPLLRLGARYQLAAQSDANLFRSDGYGGTKLFLTGPGQSESVFVIATNAGYARVLPSRRATLGASASYYDAIHYEAFDCASDCGQVGEGRFFSTAAVEANLGLLGPSSHRLVASLGYRTFEYKPDEDFDWSGEHYALAYTATLWRGSDDTADVASFELAASYRLSRRDYVGEALANENPESDQPMASVPTELGRFDLNHSAAAEVTYSGDRIYSARYELQINDSNDFGQSLVRQVLELRITTELVADVFLTATGAVQLNIFLDPLLVAPDVNASTLISIEDENRNSLSALLSRDISAHWSIEGRYSIFSNEFATDEFRFRRQTVYVGAVYDFD
jgi:hypothetical protein